MWEVEWVLEKPTKVGTKEMNSAWQAKWECELWPPEGAFSSSNQSWRKPIRRLADWAG